MVIIKFILYCIYWAFIVSTLFLTYSFVSRMIKNITTPPYYCTGIVIDKVTVDNTRSSINGGSSFYTNYNLYIELADGSKHHFIIDVDDYWRIEVGERYEFYIKNEEIKNYKQVE